MTARTALEPGASTSMRQRCAPSPRFALRTVTADAHARLDALYGALNLGDRADYARFLRSHAAAFIPVEAALIASGADALISGWSQKRWSAALIADLAALGLQTPPLQVSPTFADEAELLGGLYVLEGSRLGAAVLAPAVGAGLPTAFLCAKGAITWHAFTDRLDQTLISNAALENAAAAANAVFALFERCARAALEPSPIVE